MYRLSYGGFCKNFIQFISQYPIAEKMSTKMITMLWFEYCTKRWNVLYVLYNLIHNV